ncbi:hypothetical protein BUALT_Bualt01G0157500 [Buddleja alternifolia]|uniref:CSC1/OSCA1-like N-terminal transmembrane domain-containing protein n=1 Tax=Buddleja alternifolia TaxID=168488 RepID=A0AAV6Y7G4_9LAMI|nr:hypothetical protein BUALT_Bualt01G0157500 [Buddleja alternifolia]
MNAESLVVSASINIGLALLILTLFSILRKQPSNAPIYYARRLSQHGVVSFHRGFTFRRLLPSVGWIRRALGVTEEEILDTCGLDVLIFIRLFKFGINFFVVCSVVGLLLLLPLNYKAGIGGPSRRSHSMDAFTISNITKGSNCLKGYVDVFATLKKSLVLVLGFGYTVHACTLCLAMDYTCYISCYNCLLFINQEYDDILHKRIHQLNNMRHQPNQFTVLVREIPICDEHKARDCSIDHFFSKYHPHSYQTYQILYDGKDLDKLLIGNDNDGEVLGLVGLQYHMLDSSWLFPDLIIDGWQEWGASLAGPISEDLKSSHGDTKGLPNHGDVSVENWAIPYGCGHFTKSE